MKCIYEADCEFNNVEPMYYANCKNKSNNIWLTLIEKRKAFRSLQWPSSGNCGLVGLLRHSEVVVVMFFPFFF